MSEKIQCDPDHKCLLGQQLEKHVMFWSGKANDLSARLEAAETSGALWKGNYELAQSRIETLEAELAAARGKALEEAALIAEAEQASHAEGDGEIWIAMKIAQGIRALLPSTTDKQQAK